MDRTVRIAVIVACTAVTLAAIVVTTVVVRNSTSTDSKEAASGRSKVEDACEEAQLKLLKGEVTDPIERGSLVTAANWYCDRNNEP